MSGRLVGMCQIDTHLMRILHSETTVRGGLILEVVPPIKCWGGSGAR